jgi:hypothetical protein
MHENEPTDPEITGMLEQLQGTEHEQAAWLLLERYRAEALAGARDGADRVAKEELVNQARRRLKDALRELLG